MKHDTAPMHLAQRMPPHASTKETGHHNEVGHKKKKGLRFPKLRLPLSSHSHRNRRLSASSTASIDEMDSRRGMELPSPVKPSPSESDSPTYTVPEEHAAAIDATISSMLDSMTNISEQWTFNTEKDGVRAYSKDDGGSLLAVLGVGSVPFPPAHIATYLFDASRRPEYDSSCASCSRVRTLDAHTVVDYFASKAVLMVAGRDFVNLVHWRQLPDGTIVMAAAATTDPSKPAPSSGLVRGEIHVAGWKISPATGSGSTVAFMIKMDLKGSIPTYIQRKVALDQAFSIVQVRRAMQRRPPTPPFLTAAVSAFDVALIRDEASPPPPLIIPRAHEPSLRLPLLAFGVFLSVLYVPPLVGVDDVVHDVVVWNTIACMAYVLLWATRDQGHP